jgi:BirA family biotin operon repressor/biotin-[acetyl-CoA-carboxylase] ligase
MKCRPLGIGIIRQQMKKRFPNWILHYIPEIDSTNRLAEEFVTGGKTRVPMLIIADTQTAGKGRLGRKWISQPHKNLNLTIITKNDLQRKDILLLTMISALAVCKSLEKTTPLVTRIKWPNDVLVNGKKIAGILIENIGLYSLIGIGINVETDFSTVPELAKSSCSLLHRRFSVPSREKILIALLRAFTHYHSLRHSKKDFLFMSWQRKLLIPKKQRQVRVDGKNYRGRILGTDAQGFLRFRSDSGEEHIFHSIESY